LNQLILPDNGISNENNIVVIDIFREIDNYDFFQDLITELENEGYEENKDLFVFPYDWRLDISYIAGENNNDPNNLANNILKIKNQLGIDKVDVIAHSMGGLVAKKYIHLFGTSSIDKFIDIASPHYGSPKAFKILQYGDDLGMKMFIFGLDSNRTQIISQNFPSIYQLLPSRDYFDPENIVKLALEAKCNAVASTLGTLGIVSKKYADKIPFIVKINHNDLLRYPNDYDEAMFADVQQAYDMGAVAIGATIYFGSKESKRQISEVSEAFAEAHRLGMFTILWCYVRNSAFKVGGKDYNESADLTGQANYLGATIEADIVKQKLPSLNGGYLVLNKDGHNFGKYDELMYSKLSTDHPIDLCRYQVANCFMGRVGMISSGGASGKNDLKDAVYTAVVNKRAGGSGLILGRKAFKKSMEEGVKIIQTVQDVYACDEITIA